MAEEKLNMLAEFPAMSKDLSLSSILHPTLYTLHRSEASPKLICLGS